MTREEILKKVKEIIDVFEQDPKQAVALYAFENDPFKDLEWKKFIDSDEPIFNMLLYLQGVLKGPLPLTWLKDAYHEALKQN